MCWLKCSWVWSWFYLIFQMCSQLWPYICILKVNIWNKSIFWIKAFFSSKGMPMHFDLIILTIHMTHKVTASKHRWMLRDWVLIYCWKTQLFVHFTLPFVWKVSWTLSSRCILHSHASSSKLPSSLILMQFFKKPNGS